MPAQGEVERPQRGIENRHFQKRPPADEQDAPDQHGLHFLMPMRGLAQDEHAQRRGHDEKDPDHRLVGNDFLAKPPHGQENRSQQGEPQRHGVLEAAFRRGVGMRFDDGFGGKRRGGGAALSLGLQFRGKGGFVRGDGRPGRAEFRRPEARPEQQGRRRAQSRPLGQGDVHKHHAAPEDMEAHVGVKGGDRQARQKRQRQHRKGFA